MDLNYFVGPYNIDLTILLVLMIRECLKINIEEKKIWKISLKCHGGFDKLLTLTIRDASS
uniref:Uncharacterized protein n=1 Tax=Salix viminalis TaxID=40686 RepID=A0A6N2KN22_SALVM